MTLVFFHHALGLTDATLVFADRIRSAGHSIIVPDLYDGHVFTDIPSGLAYSEQVGTPELIDRANRAIEDLDDIVVAGQSLGVYVAQQLFQTRPTRGALFISAFIDPTQLDGTFPETPAYVFGGSEDPFFVGDGDLAAAQHVATTHPLHINLYPTATHLLTDDGTDEETDWLAESVLEALSELSSKAGPRPRDRQR